VRVQAQRPGSWPGDENEAQQQQAGCGRTERAPRSREPCFTNSALLFGLPWLLPGALAAGVSQLASLKVQLLAKPELEDAPGRGLEVEPLTPAPCLLLAAQQWGVGADGSAAGAVLQA
jgi:hypothetical protein